MQRTSSLQVKFEMTITCNRHRRGNCKQVLKPLMASVHNDVGDSWYFASLLQTEIGNRPRVLSVLPSSAPPRVLTLIETITPMQVDTAAFVHSIDCPSARRTGTSFEQVNAQPGLLGKGKTHNPFPCTACTKPALAEVGSWKSIRWIGSLTKDSQMDLYNISSPSFEVTQRSSL